MQSLLKKTLFMMLITSCAVYGSESDKKKTAQKTTLAKTSNRAQKERKLLEEISDIFFKAVMKKDGDIETMLDAYCSTQRASISSFTTIPKVELGAKLSAMKFGIKLWCDSFPDRAEWAEKFIEKNLQPPELRAVQTRASQQ